MYLYIFIYGVPCLFSYPSSSQVDLFQRVFLLSFVYIGQRCTWNSDSSIRTQHTKEKVIQCPCCFMYWLRWFCCWLPKWCWWKPKIRKDLGGGCFGAWQDSSRWSHGFCRYRLAEEKVILLRVGDLMRGHSIWMIFQYQESRKIVYIILYGILFYIVSRFIKNYFIASMLAFLMNMGIEKWVIVAVFGLFLWKTIQEMKKWHGYRREWSRWWGIGGSFYGRFDML